MFPFRKSSPTMSMMSFGMYSINSSKTSITMSEVGKLLEFDETCETLPYQSIDDVRIYPPVMVFKDVFEGKTSELDLVLQNCGRRPAFVRLCPPRSHAFKMKDLIRGKYLSPGLKVKRTVSYTHSTQYTSLISSIPLYINGNYIEYTMKVKISKTIISVEPQTLDFGTIDTGHAPTTRTLELVNSGTHNGKFAIDLGRNELGLVVEPMKGVVPAKSSITLNVEMICSKEGCYSTEFWIKCEPLCRVQIIVYFSQPHFIAYHPNATQSFTLLEFPRTYYGTKISKPLLVENCSSWDAMFRVMAEIGRNGLEIDKAKKLDGDYRNFDFWQRQGRLAPHEVRIFSATYVPEITEKVKKGEEYHKHAIAFYRILRVDCKDIYKINFQDPERTTAFTDYLEDNSRTSSVSSASLSLDAEDIIFPYPSLEYIENVTAQEQVSWHDMLKVGLYGIAEKPEVKLRPDAFDLGHLIVKEKVTRELLIKNKSPFLPIIFRYRKVPYVNVEPHQYSLKPNEGIEVNVIIRPNNHGSYKNKLSFDLLHYNYPRKVGEYVVVGEIHASIRFDVPAMAVKPEPKINTGLSPAYLREVGFNIDDVRYNTMVDIPKVIIPPTLRKQLMKKDEYIAFPNDMPRMLRLWKKTTKCTTIFARMPRHFTPADEYTLSPSGQRLKHQTMEYYNRYTREEGERLRKLYYSMCVKASKSDYTVTNPHKLLLSNMKLPKECELKQDKVVKGASFISLTPVQLYNIDVSPRTIKLHCVVPHGRTLQSILISNENDISIRVYIQPRKEGYIEFLDSNRYVVGPHQHQNVKLAVRTKTVGKISVTLDVIINECHAYDVTIQADVVPKYLRINTDEIEFLPTGSTRKTIELFNPFNIPVTFYWEVHTECFTVDPHYGCVPSGRKLACVATYTPHLEAVLSSEFTLSVDGGMKQLVLSSALLRHPHLILSEDKVVMEDIPLNIEMKRTVTLRNQGEELVIFLVLSPEPIPGITIEPTTGIIHGYADQIFTIRAKLDSYITFTCNIEIEVQRMDVISFEIQGSVEFPNILVQPRSLLLRKIIVGSQDRFRFLVENHGNSDVTINFNFEDFQEFTVSESMDRGAPIGSKEVFTLASQEYKELWLHFSPTDVAPNNFYLPLIINGLLEPPYKSLEKSVDVCENQACSIKSLNFPATLQPVQIQNSASARILDFSSVNFKFWYHDPESLHFSRTQNNLVITNLTNSEMVLCLRLDQLHEQFSCEPEFGGTWVRYEYSFVCTLQPQERMRFSLEFTPTEPGTIESRISILVKGVLQNKTFNEIFLEGTYHKPTIETVDPYVYLQPCPLGIQSERKIALLFRYHHPDCKIMQKYSLDLKMHVQGIHDLEEHGVKEATLLISYSTRTPQILDQQMPLSCTCGASIQLFLKAGSENSSFTTYSFLEGYYMKSNKPSVVSMSDVALLPGACNAFWKTDEPGSCTAVSDQFSCLFATSEEVEKHIDNDETGFPLFPNPTDHSFNAKFMRKVVTILENWLYTQVFYRKRYCKIPDDIARMPPQFPNPKEKNKSTSNKAEEPLIIQVFESLGGQKLVNFVKPNLKPPTEHVEQVAYLYSTFHSVLRLLQDKKACLLHVYPHLLLNYEDYLVYLRCVWPYQQVAEPTSPEPKTEENFLRRQLQGWTDVFLQIYKIFVLSRIEVPIPPTPKTKTPSATATVTCSLGNFKSRASRTASKRLLQTINWSMFHAKFEAAKLSPNAKIFSTEETALLTWLEYNFNENKDILWPNEPPISARKVENFCGDLSDSVVFAVVTRAFCPYLKPFLQDLYPSPGNYEEMFHNATRLIDAWKEINFSFEVSPSCIVFPKIIEMVMISVYLYEVLPCLKPLEDIIIESPLTQEEQKNILIKNEDTSPATYEILIFNDPYGCFRLSSTTLKVPPKKTATISLFYRAKKLNEVDAVMVLTGDTQGVKYAKGMAFQLKGIPKPHCTHEFTFNLHIYDTKQIAMELQCPYPGSNVYDIYIQYCPKDQYPDDLSKISYTKYDELRRRNIPRFHFTEDNSITTDEDGLAVTTFHLCALNSANANVYLYFRNHDVGDFCVRMEMNGMLERNIVEEVRVVLPKNFGTMPCICGGRENISKDCPKALKVFMPCRNNAMWRCIEYMYMMQLGDYSLQNFWQRYLGTRAGVHLLHFFFCAAKNTMNKEILHIFQKEVTYDVQPEKGSSSVTLPNQVTIKDARGLDTYKMLVHVDTDEPIPPPINFDMIDVNKREYRFYTMVFLENDESEIN